MGLNKNFDIFISHAWGKDADFERLLKYLNTSGCFKYTNHGCPFDDISEMHKYTEEELIKKLEDQVVASRVVIILSGMYTSHSKWIQREIDIADKFNRPIIAIKPWGNNFTPVAISKITKEIVGWDAPAIVEKIRKYTK